MSQRGAASTPDTQPTQAVFDRGSLPRIRARTGSFEEALALVALGESAALVPASVAEHAPASVRVLEISTKPQTQLHLASLGALTGGGGAVAAGGAA